MEEKRARRPRMRPVFEVPLPVAGEAVIAQIRRRLRDPEGRVEGVMLAAGAELTTVKSERHFWSPYLSVEVARGDDGAWADLDGDQLLDVFIPFDPTHSLFRGTMAPPWRAASRW